MGARGILLTAAVGWAALHGPSCGTDAPSSGVNAPCTRTSDCDDGLECTTGLCVPEDGGGPADAGADARASDAGRDQ